MEGVRGVRLVCSGCARGCNGQLGRIIDLASSIFPGNKSTQGRTPRTEAPNICRRGDAALRRIDLRSCRLPTQVAPPRFQLGEERFIGNAITMPDAQTCGLKCVVPTAKAMNEQRRRKPPAAAAVEAVAQITAAWNQSPGDAAHICENPRIGRLTAGWLIGKVSAHIYRARIRRFLGVSPRQVLRAN
jgi:hypothetical protein